MAYRTLDPNLLIGKKYKSLTVLEYSPGSRATRKNAKVLCLCDCGNKALRDWATVKNGKTSSCGCNKWVKAKRHFILRRPEYQAWCKMKERCRNINRRDYKDYGGRGIKVCDRWIDSFDNFLNDMGKKPSKQLSLDRINNDGNYEPNNCRWATPYEQTHNRRKRKINKVKMICFYCKNEYFIKKSEVPKSKFCSIPCKNNQLRKIK